MQRHSDNRNAARNFLSVHKEGQCSFYCINLCKEKMKEKKYSVTEKEKRVKKKRKGVKSLTT
jgi:hypothetical protein